MGVVAVQDAAQPGPFGPARGPRDDEEALAVGIVHLAFTQGAVAVVEEAGRLLQEGKSPREDGMLVGNVEATEKGEGRPLRSRVTSYATSMTTMMQVRTR